MRTTAGRGNWYGSICLKSVRIINCHVTLNSTMEFYCISPSAAFFMLIEAELISNLSKSISFCEEDESLESHISGFSAFFNLQ